MGRIKKELKEICLLDQVYVKAEDGKQSVAQYVAQVAKENGAKITVKKFVRFETGEGIEKKEENFAAGSCKADGTVVLIFKKCPKRRNRKVSAFFASMC